jgi:hypothetical protein
MATGGRKHAKQTDFTYLTIKLVTLDGFLLVYILEECNGQDVLSKSTINCLGRALAANYKALGYFHVFLNVDFLIM